jgi:hypothetical protein
VGPLTDQLRREPPGLHAGGAEYWGLAWEALAWLEREVRPGMATLETGSGASTLVFAAAGADHESVTPAADEEERFRAECQRRGIDGSRVTFRIGLSHEVLPTLERPPLDLVLIDGAHGFPYPVLDWWHLAPRLRVGGRMLLDDAYLPGVAAVVDYARSSDAWQLEAPVSFRTARIRKLRDEEPPAGADALASRGRMSFAYLPPHRRAVASVRTRVFSTRPGLWIVRKLRSPS